jgi:HEPN domain-containing protein
MAGSSKSKIWETESNPDEWLARAISNFEIAKTATISKTTKFEDLCYLCSRCVECSLKTIMILKLGKYKRGHNLAELIRELDDNGVSLPQPIKDAALHEYSYEKSFFPFNFPFNFSAHSTLTDNSLKTRYPHKYPPITRTGYDQALSKSEIVLSWVKAEVESQRATLTKL